LDVDTLGVIGTDIGGTFTDVVAWDRTQDRVVVAKAPTTSELADGTLNAIRETRIPPAEIAELRHGSTIAINTVLERSGARVALVTTAGFEDVLAIGRGNRPRPFRLDAIGRYELVPATRRLGVAERTAADGTVIAIPHADQLADLADRLATLDADAIAVCLLHSYANPSNERLVGSAIRDRFPDRSVVVSHEVCQEAREFERTSTTAVHAYVGPRVRSYLQRIESGTETDTNSPSLLVMQSNGGLLSGADVARRPALMMESGPVSGVIGTAALGTAVGSDHLIAFDMGGTTAKASLIDEGEASFLSTYYIGGYEAGLPLLAPVVDIHEIGTGGGSIAWLDDAGALHVGPRSAGSEPGPVCYGRGGQRPTVCDADLVLGRLRPGQELGSGIELDLDAAERVITDQVAGPLEISSDRAAQGIVEIATTAMAQAIRKVSIERGKDPREYSLVAYGGAGPMHASDIARQLGIPNVIIPPSPGVFSALGMLHTPLRSDRSRTVADPLTGAGVHRVRQQADGLHDLIRREVPDAERTREGNWLGIRYVGQDHWTRVPVTSWETHLLRQAFEAEYRNKYGYLLDERALEVVRLGVWRELSRPTPPWALLTGSGATPPELTSRQRIFFDGHGWMDAELWWRPELELHQTVSGPALIFEPTSVTVLAPTDSASVGKIRELVLKIG
jgi:N-methylhydantoinase A